MSKSKSGRRSRVKSTTVQLRVRSDQKAMLVRAAELRNTNLSNFMLEYACDAAQQVLSDQVDLVMSPSEWQVFCKALDAPPRSIPSLKKLFTRASVFDGR